MTSAISESGIQGPLSSKLDTYTYDSRYTYDSLFDTYTIAKVDQMLVHVGLQVHVPKTFQLKANVGWTAVRVVDLALHCVERLDDQRHFRVRVVLQIVHR